MISQNDPDLHDDSADYLQPFSSSLVVRTATHGAITTATNTSPIKMSYIGNSLGAVRGEECSPKSIIDKHHALITFVAMLCSSHVANGRPDVIACQAACPV